MPENVSVNVRATVTAGFAKDVDAVNQYAAVIYSPTDIGTESLFSLSVTKIVNNRPNAAINSEIHWEKPYLIFEEYCNSSKSNIKCAMTTPTIPPQNCAIIYKINVSLLISLFKKKTRETAGLKWAPDIGPNIVIKT